MSNGDVFKLIESLLLLPVDFLIIFFKLPPMKIDQILMIVVELARPMLCLDPYFQGLEIQREHFQIHNILNPASKKRCLRYIFIFNDHNSLYCDFLKVSLKNGTSTISDYYAQV